MAHAQRSQTDIVNEDTLQALLHEPFRFGFFAALRQLECRYPERPRVGRAANIGEDVARLGQDCALSFPPAELSGCRMDIESGLLRIGVTFLGLFGPNGALPMHLSEYALERARQFKDRTFLEFVDLFHHRFLCLFYRAWADAQPHVSHDRPEEDRFADYVASLFGYGLLNLRNRDSLPDLAKLHFAGRLQVSARNAEGLEAITRGYFQVKVQVEEFVGEWLEISIRERCKLGASLTTGTLGVTAIIGSHAYECQHRFRIRIGPLRLTQYEQLLPMGESLLALKAIVKTYVGDEFAWELQPILQAEEVPALILGSTTGRLGWISWLGTRAAETDAEDLVLDQG